MDTDVVDLNGNSVKQVALPVQFEESYRPDVIRRAFHSEASFKLQPKGISPLSGMQNTAAYYGRRHAWRQTINTGRSRVPREKLAGGRLGQVRRIPSAASGRRAHPPKTAKRLVERINLKEKNLAVRSAIASTASQEIVISRGHLIGEKIKVPVVLDNSLEEVKKAKEIRKILESLGFADDMKRAHDGRRRRSGRARLRKGGYKTPKSVLIVVGEEKGIWRATRNIPGVEVVKADKLSIEELAPGGVSGRLTIWTENALKKLSDQQLFVM
ncbi:MAG: 50S ribosomal protein L4 [Candidatus Micrarchaeia archaeon]